MQSCLCVKQGRREIVCLYRLMIKRRSIPHKENFNSSNDRLTVIKTRLYVLSGVKDYVEK